MGDGVLIVEDEAITALEMQKILESWNYDICSIVSTGEDAINVAKNSQPDLILMDIILKGEMDGVEAASKIKEFTDAPVLYITALESVDFTRLKNTKGIGYLVKPINEGELQHNIEIAIYNYRSNKDEIKNTKDNSLNDVQVFMHSIIPQLSSKLSIVDRGLILGRFHRRFEKLMKPKFLRETGIINRNAYQILSQDKKLEIYFAWINKFFVNLGFQVKIRSEYNERLITLKKCSWCEKNNENIFYCLICQAIIKQTFRWMDISGYFIENESNTNSSKAECKYKIFFLHEE
ncbi:MAG: methanogen output domain 1-containing protein [Methanobacterium sp.]